MQAARKKRLQERLRDGKIELITQTLLVLKA